jgi:AcrR family transcriptional regulator
MACQSEVAMVIGRRSQKREETRQEILAAAAKLFSEKGYALSSVEDIAAAADVVKGTFYYNFGSKEDVVIALRHQSVQKAINEAEAMLAGGASPVICIEHYLVTSCRWAEENRELASVLFSNGPLFLASRPPKESIKEDSADLANGKVPAGPGTSGAPPHLAVVLANLVAAGQSSGELNGQIDAAFIASIISFIGMHTYLTWAASGMQGSPSEQVITNFRAALNGLKSQA